LQKRNVRDLKNESHRNLHFFAESKAAFKPRFKMVLNAVLPIDKIGISAVAQALQKAFVLALLNGLQSRIRQD
jgi:hypothetical protein